MRYSRSSPGLPLGRAAFAARCRKGGHLGVAESPSQSVHLARTSVVNLVVCGYPSDDEYAPLGPPAPGAMTEGQVGGEAGPKAGSSLYQSHRALGAVGPFCLPNSGGGHS